MNNSITQLWKPIAFSENWEHVDTSILDDLTPSWFRRRQEIKENNQDYSEFIEKLKRKQAIETGVIEKLYDLSDGITQTFIKEGFIEAYIGHDDTNIPTQQLLGFLNDHIQAMDYIFGLVRNNEPLTITFIKQLHQLITKHQDHIVAINPDGQKISVRLLKGEFKQMDNNPMRSDGQVFLYCPHVQVQSEMEKLIKTHQELWSKNINPVTIAAWVHHAFTQIHPFQDGNGRIARLLASLILIKGDLFPFIVTRGERAKYIEALESADLDKPQDIVTFFCEIQKGNIEEALNYKSEKSQATFEDIANLFNTKVNDLNEKLETQRIQELEANRNFIFDNAEDILQSIKIDLYDLIPISTAKITIDNVLPSSSRYYWYTREIAQYATEHSYYFNRFLPRGWFKISFTISKGKRYDLIISIHHYSYDDSVIAVGSFLQFTEDIPGSNNENNSESTITIPIKLKPFTTSLESKSKLNIKNLESYLRDIVRFGLTIITNEIN